MKRLTDSRILNTEYLFLFALTLLAFILRVYRLDSVPPGLRMDELSNSLVVSQLVLDGQPRFFFPEAEGHEGLWHVLQAGFIAIFGRTFWGFRGVSILLGTATIPLTYLIGKQLFDRRTGQLAAALVSISFWSLMYSRVATRHISMGVFMLGAFYLFLRGLDIGHQEKEASSGRPKSTGRDLLLAGIVTAIGLYTYFASWVTPVAISGFVVLCGLFFRPILQNRWRNLFTMFGIMALLTLPLINDIRNIPETSEEGRVSVVAQPVHDALAGDFSTIWEHVVITFSMFHQHGDAESLYNVPNRPVFAPYIALIFWGGVLLALYNGLLSNKPTQEKLAYLFLIMWWVAGISPAFVSVPPSSYGHTLAAHPAVYLLLALPITTIAQMRLPRVPASRVSVLLAVVLVVSVGVRDFDAYFREWPSRGNTQFLYHSDMNRIGRYLHAHPELTDFGITGTLAGPWERLMLELVMPDSAEPRWYAPERAVMLAFNGQPALNFTGFPPIEHIYQEAFSAETTSTNSAYKTQTIASVPPLSEPLACFANGLCVVDIQYETPLLDITWHVAQPLDLPPIQINSFPPAPGAYDGLRLSTFTHLWNDQGVPIAVDDGFWVDPVTLQQGDLFRQRHILIPPDGSAVNIAIGLYDPIDGTRILTTDGSDHYAQPLP